MTALQYFFICLPYLMAAGLGLGLVFIFMACWRHVEAGLVVLCATFVLEALYITLGGLEIGISLYYSDLLILFIAAVTLARLLSAPDVPPIPWAWWIFVAVFMVNLALGLASHGSAAGVQARPSFYSIVAASYPMTFRYRTRTFKWLATSLFAMAPILVALCVYRWIVYFTPIPDLLPEEGTYNVDGAIRVIGSHQTLVLAQALLLCVFFGDGGKGGRWWRVLTPVLFAAVVVLQHRSVWVATVAGLLTALAVTRAAASSRLMQMGLIVAGLATVALPMALSSSLSGVSDQVVSSAGNAAAGEGTVGERLESWQEILKKWQSDGPRAIAIGQSIGTDGSRYVHDPNTGGLRRISYAAHNHYVQLLSGMGIVGLGSFLWLLVAVVRALWAARGDGAVGSQSQAMTVMMVMQAMYYVPYSTDYFQHVILGVAVAMATARRQLPASARQPVRPITAASAAATARC